MKPKCGSIIMNKKCEDVTKKGLCNHQIGDCSAQIIRRSIKTKKGAGTALSPCPTCGCLCEIGGNDKEETRYYVPRRIVTQEAL